MESWESSEFENEGEQAPKPPSSNNLFWYVTAALILVLVFIVNSSNSAEITIEPSSLTESSAPPVYPEARPIPTQPPAATRPLPNPGNLAELVSHLRPSVVYLWYERGMHRFSGTGFVIESGDIVTNAHVVAESDNPAVMTHTGRSFPGRVVACSSNEDLALVRSNLPADVPPVKLAGTDRVRIGDDILVFGFPLGLFSEVTVTPGIVSSIRRRENRIQLSAAVNPGNSGGPVFYRDSGEVAAVVVSKHREGEAIAFAIPVDTLKRFLEENPR